MTTIYSANSDVVLQYHFLFIDTVVQLVFCCLFLITQMMHQVNLVITRKI